MIFPALGALGGGAILRLVCCRCSASSSLASDSDSDDTPVAFPARYRVGRAGFAVMRFDFVAGGIMK